MLVPSSAREQREHRVAHEYTIHDLGIGFDVAQCGQRDEILGTGWEYVRASGDELRGSLDRGTYHQLRSRWAEGDARTG